MTGGVKFDFAATTINEAVLLATEKWRVMMEDPEAKLPWATHFEFYEQEAPFPELDSTKPSVLESRCRVTMEFDRSIIETLTGSGVISASA